MAEYSPSKIIKDGNTYNFRDTTKIPLAGSNQISGSLIPSTDGTVNLGGSSYQWNNAYIKSLTINGVACGDILTHNVSEFVDVSSNQTVGGNKEFTGTTTAHNVVPSATDTYNLGTSTNKWKSFNGINPGALSLPGNYINVDTTNWDLTCSNGQLGSFTPTADGWLMLNVNNSGTNEVNFWVIGGALRINNKSTINTVNNVNFNMITIPVGKGKTYNIYGNASEYVAGRSISYCRFMPCQGNV